VGDAEVKLDVGLGGVEPRSDADGLDGVKVDVELVLDVGDDLDQPRKPDAQMVTLSNGVDVLVFRRRGDE
jgi:hypothetical protein